MTRLALAVLALLVLAASAGAAAPGSTLLIDRPTGFGALPGDSVNDAFASREAVSDDGRFVVFSSRSDGLLPAGGDRTVEAVFVRDRTTGTTTLVSAASSAVQANADANQPAISDNGDRVAFASAATNLTGDAVAGRNVFVKDLSDGAVTLVSRRTTPIGAPDNGFPTNPTIDADGSRVAFETQTVLDGDDTNTSSDVYMRDLDLNTTTLMSRKSGAAGAVGSGGAEQPAISGNGTRVFFQTINSYDDPDDLNSAPDVFVRSGTITTLVSRIDGAGGDSGNSGSFSPSTGFDGTKVAFHSEASNLIATDTNPGSDVFVRDTGGSSTTLISRPTGSTTTQSAGDSYSPAMSSNETKVGFDSSGTLVADITPPTQGFLSYVRDLGAPATTTLVSRAPGTAGARADESVGSVSVDADGSVASFATSAGNLPGPGYDAQTVYVREGNVTEPVSGSPDAPAAVSGGFVRGSMSADGRYVVFRSQSDGLSDADDNRFSSVFLRDTLTGELKLVSRSASGPANEGSEVPRISADGSKVVFVSFATNLGPPNVPGAYVYDVATGALDFASRANGPEGAPLPPDEYQPAISGNGQRVAFDTGEPLDPAHDPNAGADVYVRDLVADTTVLVSRKDGADTQSGNGQSFNVSLDHTGNRIAFTTLSSDYGNGDTTSTRDVHVRDLTANTTTLASRATGAGASGDGVSGSPWISADGTKVVFQSIGANLDPEDTDTDNDVFLRDLAAATTTLVSREGASGPDASTSADRPQISADGSTVSFETSAPNLVPAGVTDNHVVVRTLATGENVLPGRADGAGGALAGAEVTGASLSGDGSCVAFATTAPGLVTGGYESPDFQHLYVRVLKNQCPVVPPVTTPPANEPPAADRTAPVLSAVSLSRKRFRVKANATTLRYTLSEAASVRVAFARAAKGRRKKGRCVKPTRKLRKAKRCTRFVAVGALTRASPQGATSFAFNGRVGGRKLKRGRYRMVLRATDAAGNRSSAKTLRFRVLKKR